MTRLLTALMLVCTVAFAAEAEQRPRPLGWAMDAMRNGNWETAGMIAARDGEVAADVIEWHRLRAGRGTYAEVRDFLARRSDWPGEDYLRRQSEDAVIDAGNEAILAFFKNVAPQTPRGVLADAAALTAAGNLGDAQADLVLAWRTMPMNATSQALFLKDHAELLKPHHAARLEAMLWEREHAEARQMFDLVGKDDIALAETRIALQLLQGNVNAMIDALPASKKTSRPLPKKRPAHFQKSVPPI